MHASKKPEEEGAKPTQLGHRKKDTAEEALSD